MRGLERPMALTACVAALCSTLSGQTGDATAILAATHQALGGEKNLSSVRTFVTTGRTRQVRGANLVPIEFEISCELPDKFVRRDEMPAQDADPTVSGFDRDELIQVPQAASPNAAQQRVAAIKQDFARWTLGMFAASFPSYPLTFKYAAQGEAPEGAADILDVAGPGNFSARLVVQRDTHLPVMLMWQAPGGAPVKPVEYRMYYADFRDVNGMRWPFRIRRAIGGETIEETTIDRIRVNVKIDPRKFEGRK